MRRRIYIKRKPGSIRNQSALGAESFARDVKCAKCRLIFPDYMGCCPKCGSEERASFVEVNPYSRMPMASFLKACGHIFWLVGVIAFLMLIWQTNDIDKEKGLMFFYIGLLVLVSGVIMSAAYFALSELIRRVLRIQRRLQAFHEAYRSAQSHKQQYVIPRSIVYKNRVKM